MRTCHYYDASASDGGVDGCVGVYERAWPGIPDVDIPCCTGGDSTASPGPRSAWGGSCSSGPPVATHRRWTPAWRGQALLPVLAS